MDPKVARTLISNLKELDPLALTVYQHCLYNSETEILYNFDELFKIIHNNIKKLLDKSVLNTFLKIFNYTIKNCEKDDNFFNSSFNYFNELNQNFSNDDCLKDIIFELLHKYLLVISVSTPVPIMNVPIFEIIDVYSESKTVRLRSRICLELIIKITSIINILTEIINFEHIYFGELFTHFIEILLKEKKIYKEEKFWLTCFQNLLNENRKYTIYWIKTALEIIKTSELDDFEVKYFFKWNITNSKDIINSWYLFLTILESLDGKQSHLILPSLELLKNNTIFGIWNEFIMYEIMKHTNTLVIKWSSTFILNRFTCNDFDYLDKYLECFEQPKAHDIIIRGFNYTFLYTGKNCLESKDFINFISSNTAKCFESFLNVNWKSIPFFVLIQCFDNTIVENVNIYRYIVEVKNENNSETIDLFKLAEKIKRIDNKIIRKNIRQNFIRKFETENINAEKFAKIIELLYNENEELSEDLMIIFEKKLEGIDLDNFNISFEVLKKLVIYYDIYYDILYRIEPMNDLIMPIILNCDLNILLKILPYINSTNLKESTLKEILVNIQCQLKNLTQNEDTNFLNIYSNLFCNNNCDNFIKTQPWMLIANDFKGIGQSELKNNINFSILKQNYTDQVSKIIFQIFEENHLDYAIQLPNPDDEDLLNEYYMNVKRYDVVIDLEMLLSKGSFKVLQQFLKHKYLTRIFLCICMKTKQREFNEDLFRVISNEILVNSKKNGFKYVENSIECLIKFTVNEIPEILNYILDIDPTNCEYINVIFNTFIKISFTFSKNLINFLVSDNGLDILNKGILIGEPLLGEPRNEFEFIIKRNLTDNIENSIKMRLRALKCLDKLTISYWTNENIILFRDKLLNESENLNNKKSRYFKNSKYHRIKLRIIQTLGYIQERVSKENKWTERYLKLIFEENNQNDVIFIMELVIARTIPLPKLLILLKNCSNLNNSGIISLFTITFIHCYNYVEKAKTDLIKEIIQLILPWTMGQNFNIRLNAQITIYHLIKHFQLEDYNIMLESILLSLKQGNAEKNYKKLNKDLRFNSPDLMKLLQFKYIFHIIPCLNSTEIDEWYFKAQKYFEHFDCSELCKEYYEEIEFKTNDEIIVTNTEDLQRKISHLNLDELKFYPFLDENENNKLDIEMVVVASLIDKLPNLGGIARSCEVLGIKNLAINSLKYVETKEFKSLSMTAEKWLNIFELELSNLKNYLLEMKSKGYKIIGAEQTTNSENFINFEFPKKSVLVLGNEKEGIPGNLLAFLDNSVEIPQFGMVRSLNVHITAALFMWEFCKQHIITKK